MFTTIEMRTHEGTTVAYGTNAQHYGICLGTFFSSRDSEVMLTDLSGAVSTSGLNYTQWWDLVVDTFYA